MSQECKFAEPVTVNDVADCFFYHRIALPGVGEVGEQWDLRAAVDAYLGRVNFAGKRVLDVGTASGFLTFEMEKRGAEVVSFDMEDGAQWDLVPHHAHQGRLRDMRLGCRQLHQRLKNAYWFAHQRLRSRARVFYGNIYDLPSGLGRFDVVVFGMILSHLRDPFQALYSVSRLCSGTVVVTNQVTDHAGAVGAFIPSPENGETMAWWAFSGGLITRMLAVLGFEVKRATTCQVQCLVEGRVRKEKCTAFVAQRVAGTACLDEPALFRPEAA
jgi:SAM-dependent methyltransferase